MSGSTPGPWRSDSVSAGAYIVGSAQGAVARAYIENDALLIAAAPDLLEACKVAIESLRAWNMVSVRGPMQSIGVNAYEHSPEITRLKAAIAKAEGI